MYPHSVELYTRYATTTYVSLIEWTLFLVIAKSKAFLDNCEYVISYTGVVHYINHPFYWCIDYFSSIILSWHNYSDKPIKAVSLLLWTCKKTALFTVFILPEEKQSYIGPWTIFCVSMAPIGNTFAYRLHWFDQICASQIVMKIGRNVFTLLGAVSRSKYYLINKAT